jgi:hypothetical protein
MKKIFFCSFIIAVLFSACKKDEDHVFDQSPDERLNQALANYQSQLSGAQFGWKAVIYPKGGGAYAFYFKFNDANRVQMVSDFDSASSVTLKESSYRLKALQQPSLIFDTYSYVSVLSDPDGSVNGGTDGSGLLSDFEFYFNDSTSADTLKLTGRVNGSKAVLTKATQEEANVYTSGGFNISLFKGYLNKILQYFKRLTVGSTVYDLNINTANKTVIFTWVDGQGNIQTFTTFFYYTVDGGIAFENPFTDGSTIIAGFANPVFSSTTNTINLTAGGNQATITGVNSPIAVDKAAPQRWYQYAVDNGGLYWISIQGFHVNGVDNAFRIDTLPNYYYLIYWPKYATANDLFAPVFIDSAGTGLTLLYGAAPATPTFSADGRARFTLLGTYGTYPTTGGAALTLTQLLQNSGYYFVQTSATSYDMVSVADARIWLSWIF